MLVMGLVLALAVGPTGGGTAAQKRRAALEHYRSGEAFMQGEQFEEAAEQFRRALTFDPYMVVAHYNLGYASMLLKRYPDAVRAYEGCVDAIDRLNRASAGEQEALEKARLDELNELKDSLTAVRTGKIKNMAVGPTTLRYEERIRVLEQLRFGVGGQARTPAEVYLGLGSAYFRQNLLDEAERSYTKAVRVNEALGPAHNNLAVIFMLTGRYPQAHAAIRAAEKAGFQVDPRFKADLQAREEGAKLTTGRP
jgi:tetratricopeptide (TPR) repeat protein